MKDGKTKSGVARQDLTGGGLLGRKVDKARMISGEVQSLKASGKRSLEIDAVGTTVKEKTNMWHKSCKESVKRASELYKMVELGAIDERQEHKE